jgi:hypothetical protein
MDTPELAELNDNLIDENQMYNILIFSMIYNHSTLDYESQ